MIGTHYSRFHLHPKQRSWDSAPGTVAWESTPLRTAAFITESILLSPPGMKIEPGRQRNQICRNPHFFWFEYDSTAFPTLLLGALPPYPRDGDRDGKAPSMTMERVLSSTTSRVAGCERSELEKTRRSSRASPPPEREIQRISTGPRNHHNERRCRPPTTFVQGGPG